MYFNKSLIIASFTGFLFVACDNRSEDYILDVKEILNKTPHQVEQILGKPDSTYTIKVFTKEYFAQRYFESNVEIQYPEGTSTDIVVYGPHGLPFDVSSTKAFNLEIQKSPDQYRENQLIRWYDIDEFASVTFYHPEFDSAGKVTNFHIFFKARKEN